MRTAVTEVVDDNTTTINWTYDALNRLITEDYNAPDAPNDFTHTYIYDLVGNRLERQVQDGNTTYYYYDPNTDELTQEITDDVNTFYYYDDNGSLVEEANDSGTVRSYTYDYRNRMSSANDGTNAVNYTYNADGIRVKAEVTGGSTTQYLIDPYNHTGYAQVLKETGDANTVYVLGHDVLAQATGSNAPKYLLYDGHGSVRQVVQSSSIIGSFAYDAYGNAHGFTPDNAATKLLYAGEMYDGIAAQYYLRARWYSPVTGRFNRMDPFAGNNRDPQSLHKYLYAHCNPINGTDPSGMFTSVAAVNIVAIGLLLTFTLVVTTVLNPAWRRANEVVVDALIDSIIALVKAGTMSLEDAFRRITRELRNLRDRLKLDRMNMIFLHYSFIALAPGLLWKGLLPGNWATLDPYPTGWMAKWFLALPGPPRNAVYIVWPRKGFGPTYGGIVPPRFGMPGGGTQLFFTFGSGGKGTIIGPIPLLKGRRPGP